jgi:hypothetical protein
VKEAEIKDPPIGLITRVDGLEHGAQQFTLVHDVGWILRLPRQQSRLMLLLKALPPRRLSHPV